MRLLKELRDLVTDPSARITDILRRAKVLAVTLKQDEFKAWVAYELSGYPPEADLPPYRRLNSPPLGAFSGIANRVTDCLLPASLMPDSIQKFACHLLANLWTKLLANPRIVRRESETCLIQCTGGL
jgi:hypothetical protein